MMFACVETLGTVLAPGGPESPPTRRADRRHAPLNESLRDLASSLDRARGHRCPRIRVAVTVGDGRHQPGVGGLRHVGSSPTRARLGLRDGAQSRGAIRAPDYLTGPRLDGVRRPDRCASIPSVGGLLAPSIPGRGGLVADAEPVTIVAGGRDRERGRGLGGGNVDFDTAAGAPGPTVAGPVGLGSRHFVGIDEVGRGRVGRAVDGRCGDPAEGVAR